MSEKIKEILSPALRQYRHISSPEFVMAYNYDAIIKIIKQLEKENEELKKENESHVKLIQGAIASAKDYERRIKVLDIALKKAAKCLVPFARLNPITCKKYFINQAEEEIKNE